MYLSFGLGNTDFLTNTTTFNWTRQDKALYIFKRETKNRVKAVRTDNHIRQQGQQQWITLKQRRVRPQGNRIQVNSVDPSKLL